MKNRGIHQIERRKTDIRGISTLIVTIIILMKIIIKIIISRIGDIIIKIIVTILITIILIIILIIMIEIGGRTGNIKIINTTSFRDEVGVGADHMTESRNIIIIIDINIRKGSESIFKVKINMSNN
jgi:hypothetical protein